MNTTVLKPQWFNNPLTSAQIVSIPRQHAATLREVQASMMWIDDYTEDKPMKTKQDLLPPLKEWCEALRDVHTFAPEAIIAGGALRDLNTGVKVKDIDIFLQYTDQIYDQLCDVFGEENIKSLNEFSEEQYDTLECVMGGVYEIQTQYTDTPVQVISLVKFGSPKKVMKSFDIGLCMLCHDGIQYRTECLEFFHDWEVKAMTIYVGEFGNKTDSFSGKYDWVNKSLKHAQRLLKKYPDYKIEIEGR